MNYVTTTQRLTHQATLAMLSAAVSKADEMGQPQCIAIVDASGEILGQVRMTGAKFLSLKSALAKARTSASVGVPSADIPEGVGPAIAAATDGAVTRLAGGFPIIVDDCLVGGIGVGSGSPDQDCEVAKAALFVLIE